MHTSLGLALTLALLSSAACHRTKAVSLDQGLASNRVWVTMKNESVVVLDGPKIYANKLVGFVDGKYGEYLTADISEGVRARTESRRHRGVARCQPGRVRRIRVRDYRFGGQ